MLWSSRHGTRSALRRRGTVLLEVVLALVLFVAAAAIIGGGLSASFRAVERLRLQTHAADLAVSLMSEMQLGLHPLTGAGPTLMDPPFQDWTWEAIVAPRPPAAGQLTQYPLLRAEVIVRHTTEPIVFRLSQVLTPAAGPSSSPGPNADGPTEFPLNNAVDSLP